MPKQKPRSTEPSAEANCADGSVRSPTPTPPEACVSSKAKRAPGAPNGNGNAAPKGNQPVPLVAPAPAPALVICRNKHWRYISSFHGPWLHLPPENIEVIAHINHNHPRPRPIDPAVFSDLLQIRRLVESATDLAVRAASDVVPRSGGQHGPAGALGLSFGNQGRGHKISPERKHRMRTEATQQLSRAYHLDEIASSVATMQGASTLEDVAQLVLQRKPDDTDAQYVHFFHEKIPSRALAEFTSLEPLDRVVRARPSEPEPLRTRATVKAHKEDCEGAAADLTEALRLVRVLGAGRYNHKTPHEPPAVKSLRPDEALVDDESQPSSLETRLLFQRANVYLAMACRHIKAAGLLPSGKDKEQAAVNGSDRGDAGGAPTDHEPPQLDAAHLEARKIVRANAKRAVRDYIAFFRTFQYTPAVSAEVADAFLARIALVSTKEHRLPASAASWPANARGANRLITIDQLFAPTPPAGLPPFPSVETAIVSKNAPQPLPSPSPSAEAVTYHPLLTDALHSFLLAHSLLQTSSKELQRHAYMVARLVRLADGFPLFQACRSAARGDWVEVLQRAGGKQWIELAASWESLCAPAPLPAAGSAAPAAVAPSPTTHSAPRKKALPAPGDSEPDSPATAPAEDAVTGAAASTPTTPVSVGSAKSPSGALAEPDLPLDPHAQASSMALLSDPDKRKKRWAADDSREYTERAGLVARWVKEVPSSGPFSGVVSRRKKKGGKKTGSAAVGSGPGSSAPPADSDGDGAAESGEDAGE